METIDNFIFWEGVCANIDRSEHIKKHGFTLDSEQLVKLAKSITNGQEGIHVFPLNGKPASLVVRGFIERDGKKYAIVRTIWDDDSGRLNQRTGLYVINHYDDSLSNHFSCKHIGIVPYITEGWCPYCP